MKNDATYIRWFEEIKIEDVPLVGGKNASLGEMYRELTPQGVKLPNGFAVSGATDAACAAASLVLTAPGLSVIIKAVEEARRIFERMNSYAVYRITETIRIMVFVVLAMIVFNFYPITAIMIILLAFLNDVPIMTIAFDRTGLDPKPVHWNMLRSSSFPRLWG